MKMYVAANPRLASEAISTTCLGRMDSPSM
jgi:hypothetical protein